MLDFHESTTEAYFRKRFVHVDGIATIVSTNIISTFPHFSSSGTCAPTHTTALTAIYFTRWQLSV